MRPDDPSDQFGDTRSFPKPPGEQRPYGAPLAGYEPPSSPPDGPRRGGDSSRGWMVAFFLLLLGVVAAIVIWLVFGRSDDGGTLELSTTTVDFGDQDLGKRSAVQTIVLDNQSSDDVRISSIAIEGDDSRDFQITDETTCSPTRRLQSGSSCTVGVRFRPRVREERTATLVLRIPGREAPLRVALHGAGVGEERVVLETTQLDLGSVLIGKSRTRRVTLTNAGNAPLRIQELVIEGDGAADFRISKATECSLEEPLAAGAACIVAVTFRPKQGGRSAATLAIVHDAEGSPSGVELRGDGVGRAQLTVAPTELDFGEVELGSTSDVQTVTVANEGTASFVLGVLDLAGPGATEFAVADTSTCAEELELEPDESCSVDLAFSPGVEGERTAALEVQTGGGASSRVDLTGTGTAPPGATTTTTTT
jgi:centrosomal CEP192-like protein